MDRLIARVYALPYKPTFFLYKFCLCSDARYQPFGEGDIGPDEDAFIAQQNTMAIRHKLIIRHIAQLP